MKEPKIKKLYHSISEVSKMTSLKPYVLRYWESEFPNLQPSKNRAGKRIYRNSDIEQILEIKKLLYEKKYTIEGARKQLKFANENDKITNIGESDRHKELLEDIKISLREIIEIIEEDKS